MAPVGSAIAPEARSSLEAYHRALVTGRAAARRKNFSEAGAAFDSALKLIPHDPRALAERARVRLLEGKLSAAERDLKMARSRPVGKQLASELWMSWGELKRRQKDADAARHAFARSHALLPTRESSKKLEGGALCPARATVSERQARIFGGWVGLAKHLYGDRLPMPDKPSEPSVQKIVVGSSEDAEGPWLAIQRDPPRATYHAVARRSDGKLALYEALATDADGPCGGSIRHAEVVEAPVPHVIVDRCDTSQVPLCARVDGRISACTFDAGQELRQVHCGERACSRHVAFLDPDSARVSVEIDAAAESTTDAGRFIPFVQFVVDGSKVALSASGCTQRIALSPDGAGL